MPERVLLKPKGVPVPDEHFTPAIRYGRWVLVSGISATDYKTGLVPEVAGNPNIPLAGEHVQIRESQYILDTFQRILKEILESYLT